MLIDYSDGLQRSPERPHDDTQRVQMSGSRCPCLSWGEASDQTISSQCQLPMLMGVLMYFMDCFMDSFGTLLISKVPVDKHIQVGNAKDWPQTTSNNYLGMRSIPAQRGLVVITSQDECRAWKKTRIDL